MTPVSVIIPFYNEEANAEDVLRETRTALPEAEIIAVNDGSDDETTLILARTAARYRVTPVHLPWHKGKGYAIYEGLCRAAHEACILMDGDGQFDPRDIPALAAQLGSYDLAVGARKARRDSYLTQTISHVSNAVRRALFKDTITDVGGMKALRKSAALAHLYPFEGLHRYVPALFAAHGLTMTEVPISHRPRARGTSKYSNAYRLYRAIIEVPTVWRMTKSPQQVRRGPR